MSQFFYNPAPPSAMQSHFTAPNSTSSGAANHHNHHGGHPNHHHNHHHGGRSRRSNRYSTSQNSHKQHFKNSRSQKESAEAAQALAFRKDFEAARSFDLEDDEVFCPFHLLTEDDLHSIHSASSDRSSSTGGSPDSSPTQVQPQPTPAFPLPSSAAASMGSSSFQPGGSSHLKIHQPLAQRARNPIPIVDPNSRNGSPPDSVSPARQAQKQYYGRRW